MSKNYIKTPFFGILTLALIWISKNLLKFFIPVITGIGLMIIFHINFEKFKDNIFVMVAMSFENIFICYILLSFYCINYFNKKIDLSKIIKIILIFIISLFYNYIVLLLNNNNTIFSIISYIFSFISFTLFALSIINIIIFEYNWGIKKGFLQILYNKIFFLKLFVFNLVMQIILFLLLNMILYLFLKIEFDIKYLQYIFFVFSCFGTVILIIFVNNY
jgi:hypothetical protein